MLLTVTQQVLFSELDCFLPHRRAVFYWTMASYDYGKDEIIKWIRRNFSQGETCLDVGACDGKWAHLLDGYLQIDACEIFQPNITWHNLEEKYSRVYNMDICDMRYEHYDLIIFGDVIEHMSVERAQQAIAYALPRCRDLIVGVPYLYSQGVLYDNQWEIHVQDDLTPELFAQRYPQLKLLYDTGRQYAYYHVAQ